MTYDMASTSETLPSSPWQTHFTIQLDALEGVCKTFDEVKNVIRDFEFATNSAFVSTYGKPKDFESNDILIGDRKKKLYWLKNGMPYFKSILRPYYLHCRHGKNRHITGKKPETMLESDHDYTVKTRTYMQPSRKMGCSAKITLRPILYFPDVYKDESSTKHAQKKDANRINTRILNEEERSAVGFLVNLPSIDEHASHFIDERATMSMDLDSRIIVKIKDEARHGGVRNVSEMRRILRRFVIDELFFTKVPPPDFNTRFFPSSKTIRNHLYNALHEERFAENEQEELAQYLEKKVTEHSSDNVYFRPQGINETDVDGDVTTKPFLWVYQTKEQKRLLQLYGNDICLMDGTYKTSRYSLALYFVCVPTNAGYRIVGTFLVGKEDIETLQEGVQKLSDWNADWIPKHFMVDFDDSEIAAIENVFKDCHVYLCDFHRENSWGNYFKDSKHGVAEFKDDIIALLRRMAKSTEEDTFLEAFQELKEKPYYETIKGYVEGQWLPHTKKWVKMYRKEQFNVVNTTNGLERQHEELKYRFIQIESDNSLVELVKCLVEKFLPNSQKEYIQHNVKYSSQTKLYNRNILPFLQNRPHKFLKHCLKRCPPHALIGKEDITQLKQGLYTCKSQSQTGMVYQVCYGVMMPSCTCVDFSLHHLPCKHMLNIFCHYPEDGWDKLPEAYRNCPIFNLDLDIVGEFADFDGSSTNVQNTQTPIQVGLNNEMTGNDQIDQVEVETLTVSDSFNLARDCRRYLKDLNEITFISPAEKLFELKTQLQPICAQFAPPGIGLQCFPRQRKKRKFIRKIPTSKFTLLKRRKAKKRRRPRIGVAEENRKKHVGVDLNIATGEVSVPQKKQHKRQKAKLGNDFRSAVVEQKVVGEPIGEGNFLEIDGLNIIGLTNLSDNSCWYNSAVQVLYCMKILENVSPDVQSGLLISLKAMFDLMERGATTFDPRVQRDITSDLLNLARNEQHDTIEFIESVLAALRDIEIDMGHVVHHSSTMEVCGHAIEGEDRFLSISLPMSTVLDNGEIHHNNVQDMLNAHFNIDQTQERRCADNNCNISGRAVKKSQIVFTSDVLVLALVRYRFQDRVGKRIETQMDLLSSRHIQFHRKHWELKAIQVHYGPSTTEGHYYTYILDGMRTLRIDDASRTLYRTEEVLQVPHLRSMSYVFWYKVSERIPITIESAATVVLDTEHTTENVTPAFNVSTEKGVREEGNPRDSGRRELSKTIRPASEAGLRVPAKPQGPGGLPSERKATGEASIPGSPATSRASKTQYQLREKPKQKPKRKSVLYTAPARPNKYRKVEDEILYCICKKPDDNRPMVQCYICKDWFHFKCVQLSSEEDVSNTDWFCPSCVVKRQKVEVVKKTVNEKGQTKDRSKDIIPKLRLRQSLMTSSACPYCSKKMTSSSIRWHLQHGHYICAVCNTKCRSEVGLDDHLAVSGHRKDLVGLYKQKSVQFEFEVYKKECGTEVEGSLTGVFSKNFPKKLHEKTNCPDCDIYIPTNSLPLHRQTAHYLCIYCEKKFEDEFGFRKHREGAILCPSFNKISAKEKEEDAKITLEEMDGPFYKLYAISMQDDDKNVVEPGTQYTEPTDCQEVKDIKANNAVEMIDLIEVLKSDKVKNHVRGIQKGQIKSQLLDWYKEYQITPAASDKRSIKLQMDAKSTAYFCIDEYQYLAMNKIVHKHLHGKESTREEYAVTIDFSISSVFLPEAVVFALQSWRDMTEDQALNYFHKDPLAKFEQVSSLFKIKASRKEKQRRNKRTLLQNQSLDGLQYPSYYFSDNESE